MKRYFYLNAFNFSEIYARKIASCSYDIGDPASDPVDKEISMTVEEL